MPAPTRIVVVDDSALTRRALVKMLSSDAAVQVVGEAGDGLEALRVIAAEKPDLVLLDIMMPAMSGIEVTETLMRTQPLPVVLISDALGRDASLSFEALRVGALDILGKPSLRELGDEVTAKRIIRKLCRLAEVPVVGLHKRAHPRPALERGRAAAKSSAGRGRLAAHLRAGDEMVLAAVPAAVQPKTLLCVGASTGGPPAIHKLLCGLAGMPFAVCIVQHMTPGFTPGLVAWLAEASRLPVHEAEAGQRFVAGHVYVAPDGAHLGIDGHCLRLSDAPPLQGLRPAVDFMFRSVVECGLAPHALAVLLTGMGRDGAAGLEQIRAAGGWTIAQDEASSAVDGMPRAARELGAACDVLPIDAIAPRLLVLARASRA